MVCNSELQVVGDMWDMHPCARTDLSLNGAARACFILPNSCACGKAQIAEEIEVFEKN